MLDSWGDIAETLGHFRRLIKQNGRVFIQVLNYPPHFVGTARYDFKPRRRAINNKIVRMFKRFQVLGDKVEAQLAFTDEDGMKPDYQIFGEMVPLEWEKIADILIALGFKWEIFSSYKKEPFFKSASKDMIIVMKLVS